MRAKILFLSLMTAGAAAMLLFALKERSARLDVEHDLDDLQQHRARLAAEIERVGPQLAVIEGERARVRSALAAARRNPAKAAAGPVRPATAVSPQGATSREGTVDGPQAENRLLAEGRVAIAEHYRPLVRQLNLTEAQFAQLVENLLKRYEQRMDLSFALKDLPPTASDAAVTKTASQQIDDAFRAAQTALLGPTGYEKFDFYQRTTELRRFVDNFAGNTTIAGAPITGAQADALVETMAKASPVFQNGQSAPMENIDWTAVLARAVAELSEPQLAMFKNAAIPYSNKDRLRELARRK